MRQPNESEIILDQLLADRPNGSGDLSPKMRERLRDLTTYSGRRLELKDEKIQDQQLSATLADILYALRRIREQIDTIQIRDPSSTNNESLIFMPPTESKAYYKGTLFAQMPTHDGISYTQQSEIEATHRKRGDILREMLEDARILQFVTIIDGGIKSVPRASTKASANDGYVPDISRYRIVGGDDLDIVGKAYQALAHIPGQEIIFENNRYATVNQVLTEGTWDSKHFNTLFPLFATRTFADETAKDDMGLIGTEVQFTTANTHALMEADHHVFREGITHPTATGRSFKIMQLQAAAMDLSEEYLRFITITRGY